MSLGSFALLKWIAAQEQLYARMHALMDKLAEAKVRKRYTAEKGRRTFDKLVRDAAESYVAQQMTPLSVRDAFPATCRAAASMALERSFRERFREGRWAELQAAHKQSEAQKRKRQRKQASRSQPTKGVAKKVLQQLLR